MTRILRQGVLLAAGQLITIAGVTMAPALPGIAAHFNAAPNAMLRSQMLLSIPGLTVAILAPLAGWIIGRISKKSAMMAAAAFYGVAGTAGLWLDNLTGLQIASAAIGIALAFITIGTTALIGDFFTDDARNRFIGLYSTVTAIGGITLAFVGGLLAEASWRGPFLLFALAFPFVFLARKAVPDRIGFGCGAEEAAISYPPSNERADWPALTFICCVAFVDQLAYFMLPTQIPFLIDGLFEIAAASITGALLSWQTFCLAITALFFGRLRRRFSRLSLFAIGFALSGSAYALMLIVNGPMLFALMALSGVGSALILPNFQAWIIVAAPPQLRSRAVGGLTAIIAFGQFISPILLAPAIAGLGREAAFLAAGLVLCGFSVIVALIRVVYPPWRDDRTASPSQYRNLVRR